MALNIHQIYLTLVLWNGASSCKKVVAFQNSFQEIFFSEKTFAVLEDLFSLSETLLRWVIIYCVSIWSALKNRLIKPSLKWMHNWLAVECFYQSIPHTVIGKMCTEILWYICPVHMRQITHVSNLHMKYISTHAQSIFMLYYVQTDR